MDGVGLFKASPCKMPRFTHGYTNCASLCKENENIARRYAGFQSSGSNIRMFSDDTILEDHQA